MRLLINIIILFPIIFVCSSCNKGDTIVQEVNCFYQENRNKSFEVFKNWNIGVREGEKDLYVFDFVENRENVKYRFIIKKNKDVFFIKNIYPKPDSLFRILNKQDSLSNIYPFSDSYFRNLILRFFSLKAIKIFDIENGLFLIVKDDITIIYSNVKIEDPLNKYEEYVKFNEQLWYCATK